MLPPRSGRPSHKGHVADVLRVGWKKALGYVSVSELHAVGLDALVVKRRVERSGGRGCYLFEQDECGIDGGALYAFHHNALYLLMQPYRPFLEAAGWPGGTREHAVRGFVIAVATIQVDARRYPELYTLIGRAFANPRFA